MISHRAPLVFAATVACFAGAAEAQVPGRGPPYSIAGVVTDESGNPLADVEVMMVRDGASETAKLLTRSAADGAFSFSGLRGEPFYLRVRRLGYRLVVTQLRPDTLSMRKPFRVALQPAAVELESIEIEARSTQAMKDFAERRRKRGTGHFIDRAEIERRRPAYTSDMLNNFPGMAVRPTARIGNAVRLRGCKPAVWIDGVQAHAAELDDVTRPSDVDGIEIYNSWAGIPPQFSDKTGKNCGAILVWTRIR